MVAHLQKLRKARACHSATCQYVEACLWKNVYMTISHNVIWNNCPAKSFVLMVGTIEFLTVIQRIKWRCCTVVCMGMPVSGCTVGWAPFSESQDSLKMQVATTVPPAATVQSPLSIYCAKCCFLPLLLCKKLKKKSQNISTYARAQLH